MYVCICNELPEEKIQETIKRNPSVTAFTIHDVLHCNVGCGLCLPEIHEMIKNEGELK